MVKNIKHKNNNDLEFEKILRAIRVFIPWTFGKKITNTTDYILVASFLQENYVITLVRGIVDEFLFLCPYVRLVAVKTNVPHDFSDKPASSDQSVLHFIQ